MKKSESIKNLSNEEFRRLTGVQKPTFELMKKILEVAEQKRKALGGKPNKLSISDRLLMALEYLREYRTYFHLGQSYGVSESACYRNCRWVEDELIKAKEFHLPGKKALYDEKSSGNFILIDVTESPVERPKKREKSLEKRKKIEKIYRNNIIPEKRNGIPKNHNSLLIKIQKKL